MRRETGGWRHLEIARRRRRAPRCGEDWRGRRVVGAAGSAGPQGQCPLLNRSEISKLHDSRIGNPKSRNRKLDPRLTGDQSNLTFRDFGFPMRESCSFEISDFPGLAQEARSLIPWTPDSLAQNAQQYSTPCSFSTPCPRILQPQWLHVGASA